MNPVSKDEIRRIAADVIANTLAVAMERSAAGANLFGVWMSVLNDARSPKAASKTDQEEGGGTPPADPEFLLWLISTARRAAVERMNSVSTTLLTILADHLENEMIDAANLRAQLAAMTKAQSCTR